MIDNTAHNQYKLVLLLTRQGDHSCVFDLTLHLMLSLDIQKKDLMLADHGLCKTTFLSIFLMHKRKANIHTSIEEAIVESLMSRGYKEKDVQITFSSVHQSCS